MALPNMGGLDRTLAFTALLDRGKPCGPEDVTRLLEAYSRWFGTGPLKAGRNDLRTYTRDHYKGA
jgi:hypothetical protein